jgi:hypothetical protein
VGNSAGGAPTLLLISLALAVVGALLAFDVGRLASRSHQNNRDFAYWGRRVAGGSALKPYLLVGWIFLLAGVPLLMLAVVSLIVGR